MVTLAETAIAKQWPFFILCESCFRQLVFDLIFYLYKFASEPDKIKKLELVQRQLRTTSNVEVALR